MRSPCSHAQRWNFFLPGVFEKLHGLVLRFCLETKNQEERDMMKHKTTITFQYDLAIGKVNLNGCLPTTPIIETSFDVAFKYPGCRIRL